jgi:hypothetical protein
MIQQIKQLKPYQLEDDKILNAIKEEIEYDQMMWKEYQREEKLFYGKYYIWSVIGTLIQTKLLMWSMD